MEKQGPVAFHRIKMGCLMMIGSVSNGATLSSGLALPCATATSRTFATRSLMYACSVYNSIEMRPENRIDRIILQRTKSCFPV